MSILSRWTFLWAKFWFFGAWRSCEVVFWRDFVSPLRECKYMFPLPAVARG